MINLKDVTVVIADCKNYGEAIFAIQKTLEQITPARTIFFTDILIAAPEGVEVVQIKHMFSAKDYSRWMIKELGKQDIKTSHILIIQHDGYVLDAEQWTDKFLGYDYIGAPWLETDGHNIGNGGFSLRSTKLHQILAEDETILPLHPEDSAIGRIYRNYLEEKYLLSWPHDDLAHQFSFELRRPKSKTFGFHQKFHKPFKEYVVIKRYAAMGDVIQVEPVLHYFHERGYNVVLDSPLFYAYFANHYFPVLDYLTFDKTIEHRVINLDMAYEVNPKQLHLKSYFEMAGIEDYELRNPKLNWQDIPEQRLFKKYVVIHIDRRETTNRNQYGIDWNDVRIYLEGCGYNVIQIGPNDHEVAGLEINTKNELMLMWVLGGCDFFIGVDSGPSNVAVALGKKAILFFGSVNPAYIHADLSNIIPMFSKCPIQEQHCWSNQVSTEGRVCPVDAKMPPCCRYDTDVLLEAINTIRNA